MVHPHHRNLRLLCIQLMPLERSLLHIQRPHVIHWLLSCVPPHRQNMRFAVDQCMPVPSPRSCPHHGNNYPRRSVIPSTQIQEIKIIRRKASSPNRSPIHNHLQLIDWCRPVRSSLAWRVACRLQLFSSTQRVVEQICVPSDCVTACIPGCSSEQNHFSSRNWRYWVSEPRSWHIASRLIEFH